MLNCIPHNTSDPAPLALEVIVGITVGVTILISAALLVVLVLVCVTCRICANVKSSEPQIGQFIHVQSQHNKHNIVMCSFSKQLLSQCCIYWHPAAGTYAVRIHCMRTSSSYIIYV